MTRTTEDPWGKFWRDEPAAAAGATLANLPEPLRRRLDAPWLELARALPQRAKVLDLATGGGIVLQMLKHQRRDLHLTGVDAARSLPERPGMTLRGGVTTDRLPFADASFDAVTSRFGIEYGALPEGAAEAVRVLRPGGVLCLVAHHADGPVLTHNRSRRTALLWAARGSGWVEKALNFARLRATMPLATPPGFSTAAADARARFPDQSAAWEFLTGLRQVLDATAARPGPASAQAVQDLVRKADGELARLDTLSAAAVDRERLDMLTVALEKAGLALAPVATIDESDGGRPLAWRIEGRRP